VSTSSDQLTRLLALVPYLQAHPGARLGEVAERFGVTVAQLRRDLNLAWFCGLPGHLPGDLIEVSIAGDEVTLTNADAIARPLRLTTEEALALVVALRALADVPGLDDGGAVARALAKIESAAGDAGQPAGRVAVSVEAEPGVLSAVRDALGRRRRVHLSYLVASRDETTERDVDPMRLHLVAGRSYLEGWCHRAEAVRLFRLDRVAAIQVLDVPAEPPPGARPRDLSAGLFAPSPHDVLVTLRLASSARWVADYYPCQSVQETGDGGAVVRLRTPDPGWLVRLGLRLGAGAEVLDPPELAERVRESARSALAAYEG
jgi:proteasome accessory factor C